jgi:hypothetical protein
MSLYTRMVVDSKKFDGIEFFDNLLQEINYHHLSIFP